MRREIPADSSCTNLNPGDMIIDCTGKNYASDVGSWKQHNLYLSNKKGNILTFEYI